MTRDTISFDNPLFDDQWATGGTYDPSQAWTYRDETNLQLEMQLVNMTLDDYNRYFEEKSIKPGPRDYNDFELVDEKLRFKSSSIDLINKSTGKPLALTSIKGQ